MGMIDMSGQPRSDEELQEAIDAMKTILVKHSFVLPLLTLQGPTIINCLEELQWMRKQLAEAKARRLEREG